MAKHIKLGEDVQLRDGRIGIAYSYKGNQVLVRLFTGENVKVYPKHLRVVSSIYRKPIPEEDREFTD